jgi:hypothetical protein
MLGVPQASPVPRGVPRRPSVRRPSELTSGRTRRALRVCSLLSFTPHHSTTSGPTHRPIRFPFVPDCCHTYARPAHVLVRLSARAYHAKFFSRRIDAHSASDGYYYAPPAAYPGPYGATPNSAGPTLQPLTDPYAPRQDKVPQRRRPKYTRSKNGCLTCRNKKVKVGAQCCADVLAGATQDALARVVRRGSAGMWTV